MAVNPPILLVLADPAVPALRRLGEPRVAAEAGVRFVVDDRESVIAAVAPRAAGALVWWQSAELLSFLLAAAPELRWVHAVAAGVDRLLSPALVAHPAVLTNSRGVFSAALAEFAVAAMLHFERGFDRMREARQGRRWEQFEVGTLRGRTLGVLGYGDIGRATAALARGFGMTVLAHRRRPDAGDGAGVEMVRDRIELCRRSDHLVLAAPLTPATRNLVGEPELRAMHPGAVLVNVGRGGLVDEEALVRALTERRLRGAALDVFLREPLPPEHPFWAFDNLILSPHCADRTAGWLDAALDVFLDNARRFARGEPLANVVDKAAGY